MQQADQNRAAENVTPDEGSADERGGGCGSAVNRAAADEMEKWLQDEARNIRKRHLEHEREREETPKRLRAEETVTEKQVEKPTEPLKETTPAVNTPIIVRAPAHLYTPSPSPSSQTSHVATPLRSHPNPQPEPLSQHTRVEPNPLGSPSKPNQFPVQSSTLPQSRQPPPTQAKQLPSYQPDIPAQPRFPAQTKQPYTLAQRKQPTSDQRDTPTQPPTPAQTTKPSPVQPLTSQQTKQPSPGGLDSQLLSQAPRANERPFASRLLDLLLAISPDYHAPPAAQFIDLDLVLFA